MSSVAPPAVAGADGGRPRRLGIGFVIGTVVTIVVMVFVLAPRASSAPDGLEQVAADTGIDAGAGEHALADGPLAEYRVSGVDDPALGTGLAGAAGAAVTLATATGLARLAVRRRRERPAR